MSDSGDRIVDAVRSKLANRSRIGQAKYGTTMERQDLSRLDWLRHAQEEALDLAVYLQRLIDDEDSQAAEIVRLRSDKRYAIRALMEAGITNGSGKLLKKFGGDA